MDCEEAGISELLRISRLIELGSPGLPKERVIPGVSVSQIPVACLHPLRNSPLVDGVWPSPSIILNESPVELIVACRLETVLYCAGITTSHTGFLPIVIVPSRELCSAIGLPVMGSKNLSSMKNSIGLSKRTS